MVLVLAETEQQVKWREVLDWSFGLEYPQRMQLFYWLRQELPVKMGIAFASPEPNQYHHALLGLLKLERFDEIQAEELFATHFAIFVDLCKKFKNNDYKLAVSA